MGSKSIYCCFVLRPCLGQGELISFLDHGAVLVPELFLCSTCLVVSLRGFGQKNDDLDSQFCTAYRSLE
jgi:hypothetical protein